LEKRHGEEGLSLSATHFKARSSGLAFLFASPTPPEKSGKK
jgi:hypothetical protein